MTISMDFLKASRFLIIIVIAVLCCSNAFNSGLESSLSRSVMFVGSYSLPDGIGNGIVVLVQNQSTSRYEYLQNVTSISPSALTLDHKRRYLYSVNELNRFKGEYGFVSSYQFSWPDIGLTFVNNQSSLGWQPNFITLDPSGNFSMVANYGTGNVVIYRLQNGRIGDITQNVFGFGEQAHQIVFSRKRSMVAIPYLGSELVYFYTFDNVWGTLRPYSVFLKDGSRVHLKAVVKNGTGPRHLVYSKDERYFYVIGELLSTVTVFSTVIDGQTGTYKAIQVVNLLPAGYNGRKWASAIVLHPNGKFLYASERGIHHIAIFKLDPRNGKLKLLKTRLCGKIPRHMVIRPFGKNNLQLFVTNEGDRAIQVFKILENGDLDLYYTLNAINSPTYIEFYP